MPMMYGQVHGHKHGADQPMPGEVDMPERIRCQHCHKMLPASQFKRTDGRGKLYKACAMCRAQISDRRRSN